MSRLPGVASSSLLMSWARSFVAAFNNDLNSVSSVDKTECQTRVGDAETLAIPVIIDYLGS